MIDSAPDLNSKAKIEKRKKVAIIGSGIAGLSCAWLLNKTCDVTIFESEPQIGGHSHSVNVGNNVNPLWVDMGFIVFNIPCYPNLVALFKEIGAPHQLSDMSFAVSAREGEFEYSSLGLKGLFAQIGNIFNPKMYQMIFDILRFNKNAPKDIKSRNDSNLNLGQYLENNKYSQVFINDHLLPQAAAIWSCSSDEIMNYPFGAFVGFFENHGLLQLRDRILWRSVIGGAQAYISRLIAGFSGKILTNCPIIYIKRENDQITLFDADNISYKFDDVVFATHADITRKILGAEATEEEKDIFENFTYTKNQVILHQDENLMPKRRNAWASWNYMSRKKDDENQLCVSYYMNLLQCLEGDKDYFVTLNPICEIDADKIIKTITFEHPYFDAKALMAQKKLPDIQGNKNTYYCGAYFGYGFHEDALQSGLMVAELIGGLRRPWEFDFTQSRIPIKISQGKINA